MRRQTWIGLAVIVSGVLYLLVQMGVVTINRVWFSGGVLWPLAFVAFGVYTWPRRRTVSGGSLFFILLGLGLALKHAHLVPALNHISAWSLATGLAVVLIGIHFIVPRRLKKWFDPVVVIRTSKPSQAETSTMESGRARNKSHDDKARWRLIGDLSIGSSPWVLHDLQLWNGIGDVRVNLATAHIEDGTYAISVRGWIGQVRILVPEELAIRVVGDVSVGSLVVLSEKHEGTARSLDIEEPTFATAAKRCVIDIDLRVGDVEVKRV